MIYRWMDGGSAEAVTIAVATIVNAMPIDANDLTLIDVAWAMVGLGLFAPGAAVRPARVAQC